MDTTRIRITTSLNRPHITFDILSVFHKYNVEITWMEVYTKLMYIRFPKIDPKLWNLIKEELSKVEGFERIEEIDLIAVEQREIEMENVLDIIPQGVAVLDQEGNIKYSNKYFSEKIFHTTVENMANKKITDYIIDNRLGLFLQRSKEIGVLENKEILIESQNYLVNLRPLKSEENILTGYMLALDDIKKISEIINVNRYNNPINFNDIVGNSTKMAETISKAKLFSLSDSPVLITGESGTGKELFARSIHNLSDRRNKPFIAINCSAIPEQLLESELFGYEAGSFTGGKREGKSGLFENASGGTIFLDEIGDMAPHLQAKLLRVLQEKSIRKIGGDREIPIDVRVLSATNQNIEKMVRDKKFRLDLLYRINILSINIPPLRERKEDLPILIDYIIHKHSSKYGKKIEKVELTAMNKLLDYNWPGNVRELQNVIERAIALCKNNIIEIGDIILDHSLEFYETDIKESLTDTINEIERKIIVDNLRTHSSIRETARALKVTHTLLINRIKKYNILDDEWKN